MWKGLPLPRTEYLEDGSEYFMFLDKDNIVNILDNKISTNSLDLVNPLTGESIGRKTVDVFEQNLIRSGKSMRAYFEAPSDSYLRNPVLSNIQLAKPDIENTSIRFDDLPSYDRVPSTPIDVPNINAFREAFLDEVDLGDLYTKSRPPVPNATPKASTSQLPIDPDATPKASTSQLPVDPFASDWDPFE
jgi:hypothetical protein